MATTVDPQTSIDERVLDDADALLAALEEREKRKKSRAAVNEKFKEADAVARALLAEFDLADGEVARCGPFRISKKKVQSRSVSNETEPTSRISISLMDD